jgi:hypothetical protein
MVRDCPAPPHDADLTTIRRVHVALRIEAALDSMRGPAGPLFTRGGTSTRPDRLLPIGSLNSMSHRGISMSIDRRTFMPSNRRTLAHQDGRTFAHQDGIALVATMMAIALLATLAATLLLSTMTEAAIAVSYREGTETFYAAESAMEYVVSELRTSANWSDVISGKTPSAFVDGLSRRHPLGGRHRHRFRSGNGGRQFAQAARCAFVPAVCLRPSLGAHPAAPRWPPRVRNRLGGGSFGGWHNRRCARAVRAGVRSYGARRALEATVARAEGTSGAEPNPVRFVAWSEIR